MQSAHELLMSIYGYSEFRKGQLEVIDAINQKQDVLAIMPTGSGKSVCYQLPALMGEGVSIVVSPLVSLMKDQVRELKAAGIRGAYINSSLSEKQTNQALFNMSQGMYKIIYVAPERLLTSKFLQAVSQLKVDIIAVDEAHCISQWGHDFRGSYLDIPTFCEMFSERPTLAAFTATANIKTQNDILNYLGLQQPLMIKNSYDRPNLYFSVEVVANRRQFIGQYIQQYQGESTIIYSSTRKEVEKITVFLREQGVQVTHYHAGLSSEERTRNQDAFIFGEVDVIVATNAFGMGINKPDVRHVIHYNMPKDLESYYQEAGRGGRDSEPAKCTLLFSRADIVLNRKLMESSSETFNTSSEQLLYKNKSLDAMVQYATTTSCLRRVMLNYFNEELEKDCGNCSNCQTTFEEIAIAETSVTICSYILSLQKVNRLIGKERVIQSLLGSEKGNSPIASDLVGSLADYKKIELTEIMDYLLDHSFVQMDVMNYYVLNLTQKGQEWLENPSALMMPLRKKQTIKANVKGTKKTLTPIELPEEDKSLYESLTQLRSEICKEQKVPAYIIFNNASLVEMARLKPTTKSAFLKIKGVGEAKYESYGELFIEVIEQAI